MKEFRFVLVFMALLALGMGSCMTTGTTPKLDLSTVDPAQPIPVAGILMRTPLGDRQDEFFQKYGDVGVEQWNNDPKKHEQLLDMLCGTASRNWTAITTKVKNETGLTLNGDEFLEQLQDGNTDHLQTQESNSSFDSRGKFFQWDGLAGLAVEQEYIAIINLIVRRGGLIEIFNVELHKLDVMGFTESKTTIASF